MNDILKKDTNSLHWIIWFIQRKYWCLLNLRDYFLDPKIKYIFELPKAKNNNNNKNKKQKQKHHTHNELSFQWARMRKASTCNEMLVETTLRFLLRSLLATDRHNIFSLLALQQKGNWYPVLFHVTEERTFWTSNLEHRDGGKTAAEVTVTHNYFTGRDGPWMLALMWLWEGLSWGSWFRKREITGTTLLSSTDTSFLYCVSWCSKRRFSWPLKGNIKQPRVYLHSSHLSKSICMVIYFHIKNLCALKDTTFNIKVWPLEHSTFTSRPNLSAAPRVELPRRNWRSQNRGS